MTRIATGLVLSAACLVTSTAGAAPVLVVDDPMTQPYGSGQTVNGGTFAASGWTRDDFEAQIVYDLGAPVVAGRLVFEMNGVNGVDHGVGGFPDCRAIFAALDDNGSGNIEDVGNEVVQYIWAWAMEETDYCNGAPGGFERTNRMKLLVYTNTPDNPGEPMSDPLVWDAAQFYKYEIGWDKSHAWLMRDGAMVLDQVYPVPPVTMSMRYVFLGTVNRYKSGVKNATYKNLQIWNDAPETPSDAGTNPTDAPVEDGSSTTVFDAAKLDAGNGTGGSPAIPKGSTDEADSGCGCKATPARSTRGFTLAALAILAAARRRRAAPLDSLRH